MVGVPHEIKAIVMITMRSTNKQLPNYQICVSLFIVIEFVVHTSYWQIKWGTDSIDVDRLVSYSFSLGVP